MALQINRSDVVGYIPTSLITGELFYNSADDKLYVGNPDTTISLVSDNPANIESRLAELESDSNHTVVSTSEPSSPITGDLWFDSSISQLKVYTGTEFELANDPYKLTTVGSAGVLPVSTSEFFQHIRFTADAAETTEAERFLTSATIWAEQYTGQYFRITGIEEYFDTFPQQTNYLATVKAPFVLKGGHTNSITNVEYYNGDGVLTTVDSSKYRLINKHGKGYLLPAIQEEWPTDVVYGDSDVVKIQYNTGKTPSDVPASVKSAILLIAASMFENRENEVVGQGIAILKPIIAAKDLLHPHKVR